MPHTQRNQVVLFVNFLKVAKIDESLLAVEIEDQVLVKKLQLLPCANVFHPLVDGVACVDLVVVEYVNFFELLVQVQSQQTVAIELPERVGVLAETDFFWRFLLSLRVVNVYVRDVSDLVLCQNAKNSLLARESGEALAIF